MDTSVLHTHMVRVRDVLRGEVRARDQLRSTPAEHTEAGGALVLLDGGRGPQSSKGYDHELQLGFSIASEWEARP
jgi:hypothetical protein